MLQDNYAYYVFRSGDIQQGVFIDVSDAAALNTFRKAFDITSPVTHIMSTHSHADHCGANLELKQAYPDVVIIGGAQDAVPGCTCPVEDEQTLDLLGGEI